MGSLFPCLPDEIGWKCLVRVELDSHHNLRCVCKGWNSALKCTDFYQERKRLKISEERICLLQKTDGICNRVVIFNPEKNTWKSLPPIPTEINGIFHCHFVKQKLVLITDFFPDSTKRCVWLYDFVCSKWREGTKMPRSLNKFASAADEHRGLIYMAGGYCNFNIGPGYKSYGNPVRSASVYNVEEDKWDVLPDMNAPIKCFIVKGAFVDGMFYVMGCSQNIEVFDPYTRSWKTIVNRLKSCRDFVSEFERLYGLSVSGLIEYDYSQDKLNIVGTFPRKDWGRFIEFAVLFSNKLFAGIRDPSEAEGLCMFEPQDQGFCIMEPPSERGGTFKLIDIDRPSDLQGRAICAATLNL